MKPFLRGISSRYLAVLAALALTLAQVGAQAQPAYALSQQALDQVLAPIALYPDALLSQILRAATYPAQVVEAARWSREHADLAGEAAVLAAEAEDWDPSVKSLLAFPQMLEYMRDNLQWTQALGGAFMTQQAQVMDTLQVLRHRAQAAGNLRSDDHLSVVESGPDLLLQPANTQIVYLPYYDPLLAYGPWPWAAYPPLPLRPWTGQYLRPAYAGIFRWGPPVGISATLLVGAIDWHRREVKAVRIHNAPAMQHQAKDWRNAGTNRAPPLRPDPDRGKDTAIAPPMPAIAPPTTAGTLVRPVDSKRLEYRSEFRAPLAALRPPERRAGETVLRSPPHPSIERVGEAQIRAQAPRVPEARVVLRPIPAPQQQRPSNPAPLHYAATAHVQSPPASAPRGVAPVPARAPRQEPTEKAAARPGMRP